MSNQILISSGAKLRDLDDVIIGTDGVLSSLAFNVANGVPKLDENGKILVSQLPNSVMEFKGVWNAATNTPTLANGTGNAGDVYLCNVAGTVDFGAGPIAFAVGDYAVYTGTVWARSSGATGTVTSVGVSRDGNALAITGSPITTSGTINLGFSGDNTQYINGAGNLTTFPTLITSIGLTMPAAFNVSNSPLTANGTIGVTAAGYPSQYIRGDGTLADFPTSGGGGSSVSYYFNGGTSQGTIGGTTYYEMSKTANTGAGVDFSKSGDGLITAFLTDAGDPALLQIPAGNWNYEIYASMSANGGTPELYAELYVYNGTTFTLISTSTNEILYDGTNLNLYTFAMAVPETTLTVTDRLAIKLYSTNSGGKTTTVHTQNGHLCQVITTFTTGLTALNGLTAQVQYFGTGTSGSDFNIVSSVDTHTFNLPTASATKRGALSSADWSTFNNKQNALTLTTTGSSGAATLISNTLNIPTYTLAGLGGVPTSRTLTINGVTYDLSADRTWTITAGISSVSGTAPISVSTVGGAATVSIAIANTTTTGALTSADWNTFNGKQAGSTNLTSLAALTFASTSFVKMTAAGTFALDTNTYALASALSGYLPLTGGTLTGPLNGTKAFFEAPLTLNEVALDAKWVGVGGFIAKLINTTTQPYATYIFNNGYVGIGATPANKLQIGSVGTTGYGGNDFAIGNGTNVFAIYQDNNITNFYASKPYSFQTSNVLIGITTDAGYKLYVNGTSFTNGHITTSGNVYINSGNALILRENGSNSGTGSFYYVGSGSGSYLKLDIGDSFDNRPFIIPNSNVGLGGITNPSTKLHIQKTVPYNTINDQIILQGNVSSGSASTPFYYGGLRFIDGTYEWGAIRYVQANPASSWYSKMAFYTQNDYGPNGIIERMSIDNSGIVLIGTTSGVTGGGKVQVNGNVNINGVFQINGVTIGGGGGSGVTGIGTNNYITKWTSGSSLGNSIMYENASGIGINTTGPAYALDVNGSFGFRNTGYIFDAVLYSYNSTVGTYFGFGNNSTGGRLFMSDNSTPLQLQAGGGPVLIGTTSNNGYKLQLNGSASFAYGFLSVYRGSSSPNDILVGNDGSRFYIGGNTYAAGSVTATGGFFDTSDARLKTLIEDNYLVNYIANVKAKLYTKGGRKELGYYAQDLLEILPSAVNEGSDGFLSLSYAQVHTAKIAVIEDEVTMLKNRVSELEKQLNLN